MAKKNNATELVQFKDVNDYYIIDNDDNIVVPLEVEPNVLSGFTDDDTLYKESMIFAEWINVLEEPIQIYSYSKTANLDNYMNDINLELSKCNDESKRQLILNRRSEALKLIDSASAREVKIFIIFKVEKNNKHLLYDLVDDFISSALSIGKLKLKKLSETQIYEINLNAFNPHKLLYKN